MRKVRHVYAKDDEYIAVHRNGPRRTSSGRGSYSSDDSGAAGCGCLILIVIFLLIVSGC